MKQRFVMNQRCILNLKNKCDGCLACRYVDEDGQADELYECDVCHKTHYLNELICLPNGKMVCEDCYSED